MATGIGYAFSETPIHIDDTFTFDVRAENVSDLAGWQFDIAFEPAILEAVDVSEGNFLKSGGESTFFQGGRIDNASRQNHWDLVPHYWGTDNECEWQRHRASGEIQGEIPKVRRE